MIKHSMQRKPRQRQRPVTIPAGQDPVNVSDDYLHGMTVWCLLMNSFLHLEELENMAEEARILTWTSQISPEMAISACERLQERLKRL